MNGWRIHYGISERGRQRASGRWLVSRHELAAVMLGHGSVLVQTSIGQSHVTGAPWQVGDGSAASASPPPAPPPNIPTLDETPRARAGRTSPSPRANAIEHAPQANPDVQQRAIKVHGPDRTVARQLRRHRRKYRYQAKTRSLLDHAWAICTTGRKLGSETELVRAAAAARPRMLVLRNFTEHLMAYALGRRVEALRSCRPCATIIALGGSNERQQDAVVHARRSWHSQCVQNASRDRVCARRRKRNERLQMAIPNGDAVARH